jgi:hypothetical protein
MARLSRRCAIRCCSQWQVCQDFLRRLRQCASMRPGRELNA